MSSRSEEKERIRQAQRMLDDTVRALRDVPHQFDRKAAVQRIRALAENLLYVLETSPENQLHYDAAFTALQQADELRIMLESLRSTIPPEASALDSAISSVQEVRRSLAPVADELSVLLVRNRMALRHGGEALPTREFKASIGVPTLHAPRRGRLLPPVDIDPIIEEAAALAVAPPKPTTVEELLALADAAARGEPLVQEDEHPVPDAASEPPTPDLAYLPAIEERQMMRDLARDTLEDIAGFRNLRKPIPTETWLDQAPFEQRLLNQIDYFVSLGYFALQGVSAFHAESEVADPDRAFAVALSLNTIEGADTAHTAVAILCDSAPEEMPGYTEGFQLAPNPHVDAALHDLLHLDHPEFSLVAVSALAWRGTLSDAGLERAFSRGEARVQLEVARALAHVGSPNLVSQLLDPLLGDATDEALYDAAARTLLLRGEGYVRDLLRPLLRDPSTSDARREAAFELLCLTGSSGDTNALIEQLSVSATPRRLRALGRHGNIRVWSYLTPLLASDDDAVSEAAAEALMRMSGAPELWEEGEVPWVEELPPEAYEQEVPPPMRKVQVVIRDREQWERWFAANEERFDVTLRYRGGGPFSLGQMLDELAHPRTPIERRWETAEELQFALGFPARFFCDDWVVRQQRRLEELRETIRLFGSAGRWSFALGSARPQ